MLSLISSLIIGCGSNEVPKCSNLIIQTGHRGDYITSNFNREVDSAEGQITYLLSFLNSKRKFTKDSNGMYFLGNDKLEFIDNISIPLNDTVFLVSRFGLRNPPVDGGVYYYFLDGFGYIYEKSTTWFASIKIIETDDAILNDYLPGIFEKLNMKDCYIEKERQRKYIMNLSRQ